MDNKFSPRNIILIALAVVVASVFFRFAIYPTAMPAGGANYYTIIFPVALIVALPLLLKAISSKSLVGVVVVGAVAGYFLGVISCLVSFLLTPDGIEKTINSIELFGVFNISFGMFVFLPPLLAGSWLFGGVALLAMNRWGKGL